MRSPARRDRGRVDAHDGLGHRADPGPVQFRLNNACDPHKLVLIELHAEVRQRSSKEK